MCKLKNINKIMSLILTVVIVISGCTSSSPSGTGTTETIAPVEYIDVATSNELASYNTNREEIPIEIGEKQYQEFSDYIRGVQCDFCLGDYYYIDEALDLYSSTEVNKPISTKLLDENGKLSQKKLIDVVDENNKKLKTESNSENVFYEDISNEDKVYICTIIADVVNRECDKEKIKEVATSLEKMCIVYHRGQSSNAAITNHMVFTYNDTMSKMTIESELLKGTDETEQDLLDQIIVHEVMHLIQHANDDLNDENGVEIGIVRQYNVPYKEPMLPVDSLYNSWLLEGSAELGMAYSLDTTPKTYAKYISYINSYNLSRFDEIDSEDALLEKISFSDDIDDMFAKLGIDSVEEQDAFLKCLYSTELIQTDSTNFWEKYSEVTQKSLSEDEKMDIKYQLRIDIIKYLTKQFYVNLIDAVYNKEITDLNTLFYMMRLWEIDEFWHLNYNQKNLVELTRPFIEWHCEVQDKIFGMVADSTDLTQEETEKKYNEYCLQTKTDGVVSDNCNLSNFSQFNRDYIQKLKQGYTKIKFVRLNEMMIFYSK